MLKNPMKKIESLVNVTIAAMAIVLIAVLINRYAGPGNRTGPGEAQALGSRPEISIEGIDWAKNRRTVVLALTQDCSYCDESAAFYKALSQQLLATGNGEFIAVFPRASEASKDYMQRRGIAVSEVRYMPFKLLGVTGTPTLMLINEAGIVTDKWAGKLGPNEEREVLDRLRLNSDFATDISISPPAKKTLPANLIEPAKLKEEINQPGRLIVLDIRTRDEFGQGHIPSSKNIPVDELEVRAINELPQSGHIVIYCDDPGEATSRFASLILNEQKFGRVSVLHGGMSRWRETGLPLVAR